MRTRTRLAACAGVALAGVSLVLTACAAPPETGVFRWERTAWDPASDGPISMVDVGGRLVGIGPDQVPLGSADGVAWGPITLPSGSAGGGEAAARIVAAGAGGAVVLGTIDGQIAAWTSTDGETWRVSPDPGLDPPAGFPRADVDYLAAGPGGFVGAGTAWGGERQRPVTWSSRDGREWTLVEPLSGSGPRALLAFDNVYVLATAQDAGPRELTHAGFWWSPDGREWTAGEEQASFGGAEPSALAAAPSGLVAVGYRMTPTGFAPMAWTSVDGRAWEPADDTPAMGWWAVADPTPAPGSLSGTMMGSVAAIPGGFVATGTRFGTEPGGVPGADGTPPILINGVVWRTADGRSWELLDDSAFVLGRSHSGSLEYGLTGVGVRGDQVIVLGRTAALGWTIWRSPVPAG